MKRALPLLLVLLMTLSLAGAARAGFVEGATAYNAQKYDAALREILPLAKAGNADAQHLLGLMYYTGRGVKRDYKLAMEWHRKAAVQGKADAQYVIGAMYYTGNAVPQDQQAAVLWFRRAAEQGHADAQHALALMTRYHVAGVQQDPVVACMLWQLAAAGGNRAAPDQRAAIVKLMTAEQVDEADRMAKAWKVGMPLPTVSKSGATGLN